MRLQTQHLPDHLLAATQIAVSFVGAKNKSVAMQIKTFGCALDSLQATTITIELNLNKGHHRTISGLPDDAIKESLARIEAAITNAGFMVPDAKIVYCLSPAYLPKRGTVLDLPMAIYLLAMWPKKH